MSAENVELARSIFPGTYDLAGLFADPKAYAAFRAALEARVHSDLEIVLPPEAVPPADPGTGIPSGSSRATSFGIDGFMAGFGDWLSAWESWVITPDEVIDVDDERVLVLLDIEARSKTHGVEMPVEGANLLTVRDGKLARLELFLDRAEARAAAGL
jgi:hypothetical protein